MRTAHALAALALAGTAAAAPLPVSATTTIVADFVRAVGGARVAVTSLVPVGADTHAFQPSTRAIRSLSGARVLFANGANLEPWLPRVQAAAPQVQTVALTQGLKLRPAPGEDGHEDEHGHGAFDPHAWWDAGLAAGYARRVADTLTRLDPAGRHTYANNLQAFTKQLNTLDAYAKKQFATVPAARRRIVTNHDSLHYFAARYGLTVVGTVLPGIGTEREPSARELAALTGTVKKSGARVILTENTVNPRLAQTLARETGARIAPPLYTDALGPAGSAGETYLKALRHNVDTVVGALKGP